MMKKILVIVLCLACTASFAQKRTKKRTTKKPVAARQATPPPVVDNAASTVTTQINPLDTVRVKPIERPIDGFYKKESLLTGKATPYPALREADVVFAKRVWREIDVREKMNQYFASPKSRLIDILLAAISAGELTAYDPTPNPAKNDPNGDSFSTPLSGGQAKAKMADSSVVDQFDAQGNKIGSSLQAGEFNPDSVVKFRLKEDWVFDRNRSIFEPRIIGIAPLIKLKATGLDGNDYQPAFWVYFPEARNILATKEAISRNSDATGLSFDDMFLKRLFSSYIVKVSNDKDERIKDYAQGIDRLYESERIKKSLMDWELTLWQY